MSEAVSQWQPQNLDITLTEKALQHVQKQIGKAGRGIGLRFGIRKSGCSGYAYDVQILEKVENDDKVFDLQHDLKLAVDKKHLPVLQGTEIDYIQDGINYRFQFNNPNEEASCGCGESFSVDPEHSNLA